MRETNDLRRRVVVMLGMHNSGTSLLANVVRQIGVDLGPDALTRGQAINTAIYDYWENAYITDLQDRLLHGLDRHWRSGTGALPLPASAWVHPLAGEAREALSAYISGALARSSGLWGFKDPRTARLLPLWREVLDSVGAVPLFLIGVRAPGQTVASFATKAGVPPAWAEALWLRHYLEILEGTAGTARCFVDYDAWFAEPQRVAERIAAFLGTGSAPDAAGLVDASLPRFQGRRAPVSPRAEALYTLCRAAGAGEEVADAVRELRVAADAPRVVAPPAMGLDGDGARMPRLSDRSLRACIVTSELTGFDLSGGIGTAAGALAVALAEAGHAVTVLHLRLAAAAPVPPVYARLGIRIEPVPGHLIPGAQRTSAAIAYAAFRWLRTHSFDIVHHHDWLGTGYFLGAAKRSGLAFRNTVLCCTAHGPTAWVREGNGATDARADAPVDTVEVMEAAAIATADILVSPSAYLVEWMRARGWTLPERVVVQQNLLAFPLPNPGPPARPEQPTELVFYGRLEARKGVALFCDALDRLGTAIAVTFLGAPTATIDGDSAAYVRRRAMGRGWRILDTLDRTAALAYLRRPGRIAVIPSLIENSPYTVLECLVEGIPFLASHVGGIPELIAEDDHTAVLFDPTAPALAERLAFALRLGVPAARPRVDPVANRAAWIDWHQRLPRAEAAEPVLWSTDESRPAQGAIVVAGVAARHPTTADAEAQSAPDGTLPAGVTPFFLWARVRTAAPGDIVRMRLTSPEGRPAFLAEAPINGGAGEWFLCQEVARSEGAWPPGRYWAEWAVTSPATGWSNALSRWLTVPAGANG